MQVVVLREVFFCLLSFMLFLSFYLSFSLRWDGMTDEVSVWIELR